MATDIAALGLAVESGPVEQATAKLGQFAQAAKTAEGAAKSFGQGTATANTATAQLAAQVNKAITFADRLDQSLNVRTDFGTDERAADIAAYMKSLDDLRAKFNPLYAAERQHATVIAEINQAARVGAISEAERAMAVMRADAVMKGASANIDRTSKALNDNAKSAGLASYQLTNLGFQLNDVVTLAALGVNPLQILASQGGQVFQILQQGAGGATGSLRTLVSMFTAAVTPVRAFGVATVAAFAGGAVALNSFLNAQRDIQFALVGMGSAAGLTATGINSIVLAATNAGKATVGEAQEMALAFAATGKIGDEVAAKAIAVARNVGRVFGEDSSQVAARLAAALAEPAKGVDALNARLGAFDARTVSLIKSLDLQNDKIAAQRILIDGVARSTAAAELPVNSLEKAWLKVAETVSYYYRLTGQKVDLALGGGSLEDKMVERQRELEALIEGNTRRWTAFTAAIQQSAIDRKAREILELGEAMAKLSREAEMAKLRAESVRIANIADGAQPATSELQRLRDTLIDLQRAAATPGVTAGMSPEQLATLARATEFYRRRVEYFASGLELARQEHAITLQLIAAQTVQQRAAAEHAATLSRLRREGDPDAEMKAQLASQRVFAENAARVAQQQQDQRLAARQGVEQAQIELSLIGRTTAEQQLQRELMQAKHQAQQEALRLYGDENAYDKTHLAYQEQSLKLRIAYNEQARQESLRQDIGFERSQMSRTSEDQEVYQRLRAAGLLTNNEIEGAAAQAIAQQMRINSLLRQSSDMGKEFTKGFVHDLMAGTSATEALGNALNRLSQRLADLAIDNAIAALFGGATGGTSLLAGLLGGGGNKGAAGGWITSVFPSFHTGGVVGVNDNNPSRRVSASVFRGARRYHGGGIAGLAPDEVPAILQKGEEIIPRGGDGGGRRGTGGVRVTINMPINAQGAYPESIADIKRAIAERDSQLQGQVVRHVQSAIDRRMA